MAEVTFTRSDCEVLDDANCRRTDLNAERRSIRNRLVELDEGIPNSGTSVLGLDLHHHWSPGHLTSIWYPISYNGNSVKQVFLRYGKSRAEMLQETLVVETDPEAQADGVASFLSHVHLSTGLDGQGFFYQVIMEPNAIADYDKFLMILGEEARGPQLLSRLTTLEDAGYRLFLVMISCRFVFHQATQLGSLGDYGRNTATCAANTTLECDWTRPLMTTSSSERRT